MIRGDAASLADADNGIKPFAGAVFQLIAVPFLFLSRREQPDSDTMVAAPDAATISS